MASKDFHTIIKRGDAIKATLRASGFTEGASSPFVNVVLGAFGDYSILINPSEARAFAEALMSAADYAEPRVAEAADLGIAA